MFFRLPGMTWQNASAASNRADLEKLSHNEVAPGLVAYRDGRAIGWVGLAPRADYGRLASSKVLKPIDDKPVWSIVCFVVSRGARRQGVGHELLKAAINYAHDSRRDESSRRIPCPAIAAVSRLLMPTTALNRCSSEQASRWLRSGSGTRPAPSGRSCASSSSCPGRRRSGRASSRSLPRHGVDRSDSRHSAGDSRRARR